MMTAKNARTEKRRANKPLMEKRRRARINHSLAVLKSLIIKDEQSEASTSQSRLEKADILELTVMHLRSLEAKRKAEKDEPSIADSARKEMEDVKSYQLGYQACCKDVELFLKEDPDPSKDRLLQHLARSQKKKMPSQSILSDNRAVADAAATANITPTRLPDGRLALVFSSPCSWLSTVRPDYRDQQHPAIPATPPSSPAQQVPHVQPQPLDPTAAGSSVWRPWF